jgi:mycothiol system anti-sigma-R factor
MKGCDVYGASIQLYLDQELSGEDREEFRRHLEECEACRTELKAEEQLSRLLHRARPLYSAPDTLRERVIRATAEPLPPVASKVLWGRLQPAGRRAFNWPALIAATLLVIAGLPILWVVLLRARANSYIETAVKVHRSFLDGGLPLEVQSGSPSVVSAWFAGKVPFSFRLPSRPGEAGREPIYRLTGGRLVNYKGAHIALVAYQTQQQNISLLVASSKSAVVAGGEEVPSGGIVFHYRKQDNFNVITWSNHGLAYALVSSLPGVGRQSCLVCHQYMTDGDHFSASRPAH